MPPTAHELLGDAVRAGDSMEIARLAEVHLWELFNTSYHELTTAIRILPAEIVARHANLRLLHPAAPAIARTVRPLSTDGYASTSGWPATLGLVMRMIVFRLNGDIHQARQLADQIAKNASTDPTLATGGAEDALWFCYHQIGATMLMQGELIAALCANSAARQLGEAALDPNAIGSAHSREALAYAARGSLAEAEQNLQAASRYRVGPAYVEAYTSTMATAQAQVDIQRMNSSADSSFQMSSGIECVDVVWPFVLLTRIQYSLARQQPQVVLDDIALARKAHRIQPGTLAADIICAATTEAFILLRRVDLARQTLEETDTSGVYTRLASVRLSIHEADLNLARALLTVGVEPQLLSRYHQIESMLLAAWIEFQTLDKLTELTATTVVNLINEDSRQLLSRFPRPLLDAAAMQADSTTRKLLEEILASLKYPAHAKCRTALSANELLVLDGLRRGLSQIQIAAVLQVSVNTVKTLLQRLYRKLDVNSRHEAVLVADRYQIH